MLQPRQATIRLTNACNARCKMCGIWEDEDVKQFDIKLLDKLPKSLRNITLSGGEPFLRKDIPDIVCRVRYICKKARIVIPTNGILTDTIIERMGKIINIDPKIAIRVSVDGIGKVHDEIRGIRNAYNCAMNTLKYLKNMKVRDLGIIMTVTDININEIEKVYNMSRMYGIRFNCQVANSSYFYFNKKNDKITNKYLLKKELDKIISSELKGFDLQRLFKAYFYKGLLDNVNGLSRSYHCNAGCLFFYVNQDGTIYPCQFLNKEMGNLHRDDFAVIWNSQLADLVRKDIRKCNLDCWNICTIGTEIKHNPFPAAKWILVNKLKAQFFSGSS